MIRETSIDTYRVIIKNGLLSQMRSITWVALYEACLQVPVTAGELVLRAGWHSVGGRGMAGNVHARLGELRDRGVARECKARICSVTGRRVITWTTTDALPKTMPPRPQSARPSRQIKKLIALLKAEEDEADRQRNRADRLARSCERLQGLVDQLSSKLRDARGPAR